MKHVFGLAVLIAAALPAVAQEKKPAPPPAGSAEMSVAVELTGRLKVTETGAELTFVGPDCSAGSAEVTITGPRVWKVDLSRSAKLREKAAALDGKEVTIKGTARLWLAEQALTSVPVLLQPLNPPPPSYQYPEGPPDHALGHQYVITPPLPPAVKTYHLVTERVVKATSLRAKK